MNANQDESVLARQRPGVRQSSGAFASALISRASRPGQSKAPGDSRTPKPRGRRHGSWYGAPLNLVQLSVAIVSMLVPAAKTVAAGSILTIAIFDFASPDEAVRDLGPKVATLINANLS